MDQQAYQKGLDSFLEKNPKFKGLVDKINAMEPADRLLVVCFMTLTSAAKVKPNLDYHSDLIKMVLDLVRQVVIADTMSMMIKHPIDKDKMILAIEECQDNINRMKPQIGLLIEGMEPEVRN